MMHASSPDLTCIRVCSLDAAPPCATSGACGSGCIPLAYRYTARSLWLYALSASLEKHDEGGFRSSRATTPTGPHRTALRGRVRAGGRSGIGTIGCFQLRLDLDPQEGATRGDANMQVPLFRLHSHHRLARIRTAADHASSRENVCGLSDSAASNMQKIPRAAGCEAGSQPGRCEKPGRSRPGSGHTSCIDISRCCTHHRWKLDDHLAASPAPVLPVHGRPPLACSLINVQTLRRKRAQIRERVGTQRRLESVVRGRETVANRAALSKLAQRRQRGL
jgi:hypothetical protein